MNFSFLKDYYGFFLEGTKITLFLSLFTIIFGIIFGMIFALMRISHNVVLKSIASIYIEFIRGTPVLVQLCIVYYGLPILGINFPEIMAGIIALSINSSAYVAEIIRAGIQAVDKGQMEAAKSLGLTYSMAMKNIILPQAIKNILPALGNEFITIIKESSIVSIIGIHELMYNTDTVRGNTFKPFEPLIISATIYFILTFSLSKILSVFERRLRTSD
ncbi:amino acid ABC transporter permease [Sporanaerobacter acetigenes]|uniref:Amino acid ABC transporter membrane protein, PAAT family (TC 3.A.1.3.-) n=1 Tax=Sporanaerobacter acetigenes DSM 13106 TaxID=1123281 RepID=A0A1M5Z1Y5_9FIRM|nr:amino acid ABC transporter permease [Sporanaerobacter acetigenes]SHI18239.1 amino acid ABC transporter membrane protein, PAAT family (TC 3.A.1.3.-) [Sporanaerobacter acetigenes DSM 13106]